MRITRIAIENYRSVKQLDLELSSYNVFVGPNGAGKSNIQRALHLFFEATPTLTNFDRYGGDSSVEVSVGLTFADIPKELAEAAPDYVKNGQIFIERRFAVGDQHGKHYGHRRRFPAFEEIRGMPTATTQKARYDQLAASQGLPRWKNQGEGLGAMLAWERGNPDKCEYGRDDGRVFAIGSGTVNIERFIRCVYIQPMDDSSSFASDGRHGGLGPLIGAVARTPIASDPKFSELQSETSQRLRSIHADHVGELQRLGDQLQQALKEFAPEAAVQFKWSQVPDVTFALPMAEVSISEDGFAAPLPQNGHGLQRTFIMSTLQVLSVAGGAAQAGPMVLCVEEPESYQHPVQQRRIRRILQRLAARGVSQVCCTTHSPFFAGIGDLPAIQIVQKNTPAGGGHKATTARVTSLARIAERLQTAYQANNYSADTLLPRLRALDSPTMNELFFCRLAVLVEGESDRAAILAAAELDSVDLEAGGVAIIPCNGKTNIDRPLAIALDLGIRTYVVFDGDKGSSDGHTEANQAIARLLTLDASSPLTETYIGDAAAWFEVDREHTMAEEIPAYDEIIGAVAGEYGFKRKQATKSPLLVAEAFRRAAKVGQRSASVLKIVRKIHAASA